MLSDLRKQIDLIDCDISKLLEKRLNVVLKIAKIKSQEDIDIYDEERENVVLKKVKENVSESVSSYVGEIYKKIFEVSRECQKNEK